jgi:hypothetical protein
MKKNNFLLLFIVLFSFGIFYFIKYQQYPQYKEASIGKELLENSNSLKDLHIRFLEYWHYRYSNNIKKSYLYELPSYRFIFTNNDYFVHTGLLREELHVILQDIANPYLDDENIALVTSTLKNHPNYIKKEIWVYVNNQWFHTLSAQNFPGKDIH